jgi:hypothetical protein
LRLGKLAGMPSEAVAHGAVLTKLRRFLLALLALGILGTGVELLLLEHYEDSWQLVPLGLDVIALVILLWHALDGGPVTVRAIQAIMAFFLIAGALGVILHYRGNMGFQLDMDPALPAWELFKRVMHAKAPPALAPGVMAQLGLLGLAYCYRHPAVSARRGPDDGGH